jgi:hypothetical protein
VTIKVKKEMLGVKVDPEMKEKLKAQGKALGYGDDLSDYIRAIYTAALGEDPVMTKLKAVIGQALIVILACQGRSVSTEQAVKLTRDLFISGAFSEDLK